MADHASESVFVLLAEGSTLESSSGSSSGSLHLSLECFMVEVQEGVVEDLGMGDYPSEHTPPLVPAPAPENDPLPPQVQLEQLQACQKELRDTQLVLEHNRTNLLCEIEHCAPSRAARAHAVVVQQKINNDAGAPSFFECASQNMAAAVAILDGLPPPAMPEEKHARKRIQWHLRVAAN